jgi:hypothetical protein
MENYTVLLSEEVSVPVTEVSAPLAAILDRTPGEVTRGIRQSPWVLLRDVPAEKLDAVFGALSAANVPARAVPESWLLQLPRPLAIRVADPMPKGLFLQSAEPPSPPVLPWDDLSVVSLGFVTIEGEPHYLVDLVTVGDTPLRFRIDGLKFSHAYLKERMRPSTRENLKLFLGDVRKLAPEARFTQKTVAFLNGEVTATFRFPSVAAFDDYTQWVVEILSASET